MKARTPERLTMELDIDLEGWPPGPWPALAEDCAAATAKVAPELANERLIASMLFTSGSSLMASLASERLRSFLTALRVVLC